MSRFKLVAMHACVILPPASLPNLEDSVLAFRWINVSQKMTSVLMRVSSTYWWVSCITQITTLIAFRINKILAFGVHFSDWFWFYRKSNYEIIWRQVFWSSSSLSGRSSSLDANQFDRNMRVISSRDSIIFLRRW